MSTVILLRGANVGSKRFSPIAVVEALGGAGATSIGAAGTFIVKKPPAATTLHKRLTNAIPFEPEYFVFTKEETLRAFETGSKVTVPADAKRFVTAMNKTPGPQTLPIEMPQGSDWGVRILKVEGRFAFGARRSVAATGVYPNEVIEKKFDVRATTRDWATFEKIVKLLGD